MFLELTVNESEQLRDILGAYSASLRREVSRTEQRDMRHELVVRLDLCEEVLARLDAMLVPVA